MKMRNIAVWVCGMGMLLPVPMLACTSAIVSGKATKDGRPLLWKHRDTSTLDNRLAYCNDGGKYAFVGLVNSNDMLNESVWMGCNTEGFAIMNTASYNLKAKDDTTKLADMEGVMMKKALSVCRTVDDFQHFLDTISKPMCVEANFGMIDAQGNGAYFEVNNFTYKIYDVNDPSVAPDGYLVRTNYSYSGRENQGMGYIRHENTMEQIGEDGKLFTPEFFYADLGRTFYHSLLKKNYSKDRGGETWVVDQDFIPRSSTSSAMVVQGVKPGDDPRKSILWTVLGYPPATPVYPVLMYYPELLPESLSGGGENNNAPLCDTALRLKKHVFPIERGSGPKYIALDALYPKSGKGVAAQIADIDKGIRERFSSFVNSKPGRKSNPSKEDVRLFYKQMDDYLKTVYSAAVPK